MQYGLLLTGALTLMAWLRHARLLRRLGYFEAAWQLIRDIGFVLGCVIYAAMLCQEAVLLRCGQLSWRTGLPLHLCSMMGLLSLPMLLTENDTLRHVMLYLGMPGAMAAVVFPCVLPTPWPQVTELSFHLLHAGVLLCPLVPLYGGWKPRASGALQAGAWLLAAAAGVSVVNGLTGGNYLFLQRPPLQTLAGLARNGLPAYRLRLFASAALILGAEGLMVRYTGRK